MTRAFFCLLCILEHELVNKSLQNYQQGSEGITVTTSLLCDLYKFTQRAMENQSSEQGFAMTYTTQSLGEFPLRPLERTRYEGGTCVYLPTRKKNKGGGVGRKKGKERKQKETKGG